MSAHEEELERIRREYARREATGDRAFYALHREANLFFRHGQERALRDALAREGLLPLTGRRVLEIGCGEGQWLGSFRAFGADEGQLCGIELDDGRASVARARYPGCDVRTGDAAKLPWEAGSFDVVFQSTVFSSILDDALLANVARAMARVLRPGGRVLSYDFAWDNPRNRAVRGIGKRRLAALFPGFRLHAARVTLAPPLARHLVPRSVTVSSVLESLRLLNTHLFATLTPP